MSDLIGSGNYTEIISRVMDIQDITWGDPKRDYVVRFRGLLKTDIPAARSEIFELLEPHNLSAIFRKEGNRTTIMLVSDPLTALVTQVMDVEFNEWIETDQPIVDDWSC